MIKADLKRLGREFRSRVEYDAFLQLYMQRLENPELKIPLGLDRYFAYSQDSEEKKIGELARRFHQEELERMRAALKEKNEDWAATAKKDARKEKTHLNAVARLEKRLTVSLDKITPLDERIFPGYFAPVILANGDERLIVPMRYRVRLPNGEEVPSKYNVFNARRDSLLSAQTWKPLFGHRHAIFPFTKFFEWVERDGKKTEIAFTPQDRGMMWAACLYSNTKSPGALPYRSFAMVTDEPPPEVAAAGHDRCPVFLGSDKIDEWLHPDKMDKKLLLALLDHKEKAFYLHGLVA